MKIVLVLLVGIVLLACLLMVALSCAARPPQAGLVAGRLRPCPGRPNCVSSEAEDRSVGKVEPLRFRGPPARTWQRLQATIRAMGGKIERQSEEFLWATFTTRVFRFVDDMEFRMAAEEGVIHVRSASRVGYSDFGLNRRRVEELRSRFDPGTEYAATAKPDGGARNSRGSVDRPSAGSKQPQEKGEREDEPA